LNYVKEGIMGHFLDIAYKVLKSTGTPLSSDEITEIGLKEKWLVSKGKTPSESMRARLSTNILNSKGSSFFIRTQSGKFGLREWQQSENEYIAPRFKKSLMDEDIVVFSKKSLHKYVNGPGLHVTPPNNRTGLVAELKTMRRSLAEDDFTVIQLISAFIVRFENRYLTYKRTKRLPESRLHGYYSIPFGGHLNENDILPLFDIFNPEVAFLVLQREFEEEIRLPNNKISSISFRGLLYDNSREVSKQHLGVVYDVYLDSSDYLIGERGFLIDPKFETLNEIESRRNEFENWSWIILDAEKKARHNNKD
jgi:predicted NUDIX family phosphoesterase